jgi:hypothetical protein
MMTIAKMDNTGTYTALEASNNMAACGETQTCLESIVWSSSLTLSAYVNGTQWGSTIGDSTYASSLYLNIGQDSSWVTWTYVLAYNFPAPGTMPSVYYGPIL